jgi:hypothetical protein
MSKSEDERRKKRAAKRKKVLAYKLMQQAKSHVPQSIQQNPTNKIEVPVPPSDKESIYSRSISSLKYINQLVYENIVIPIQDIGVWRLLRYSIGITLWGTACLFVAFWLIPGYIPREMAKLEREIQKQKEDEIEKARLLKEKIRDEYRPHIYDVVSNYNAAIKPIAEIVDGQERSKRLVVTAWQELKTSKQSSLRLYASLDYRENFDIEYDNYIDMLEKFSLKYYNHFEQRISRDDYQKLYDDRTRIKEKIKRLNEIIESHEINYFLIDPL